MQESTPENRDKAAKQLERAEALLGDAEEYKELLDERDKAERSGGPGLKGVLERLKASKNYNRRLKEAERRFRRLKADLIPSFRLHWRGAHREWMDAAMVLGDDGTPKYPALLGSGGNDGRLDFTNNFMKRIGEVFDLDSDDGKPRSVAPAWICGALWGTPVPGNLSGQPVGQYLPGTAGGANNANGPDSDGLGESSGLHHDARRHDRLHIERIPSTRIVGILPRGYTVCGQRLRRGVSERFGRR